ncbi:MAG: hypothetical protein ACK4MM_03450 [Fervidobacterium sp.]
MRCITLSTFINIDNAENFQCLIFLIVLGISSVLLASGTFYAVIDSGGTTWSQILTFTVKQNIRIDWNYDETNPVPVDTTTNDAIIGYLGFTSNKAFKVVVNPIPLAQNVQVEEIKIGNTSLVTNQVVLIVGKQLYGNLYFKFSQLPQDENSEFSILVEFTFLPF